MPASCVLASGRNLHHAPTGENRGDRKGMPSGDEGLTGRKPGPLSPLGHFQSCAVKASANSVFCSTSCAFAEPVAGLALAERFTECTGRSFAMYLRRGNM